MARSYVRNGVWGWTIEAQERALEIAGRLDRNNLFCDALKADQAKNPGRVRAEWLIERKGLLRVTARRGETIAAATPLALAVNQRDLTNVLRQAAENRSATVLFVDSGLSISPDAGMAGASAAIEAWEEALKKATMKSSRIAGNVAAAAAKRKMTAEKLKIAEPLWPLPTEEVSNEEIAARSGLSVKTLYNELGPRGMAQVKRLRSMRRKSRVNN